MKVPIGQDCASASTNLFFLHASFPLSTLESPHRAGAHLSLGENGACLSPFRDLAGHHKTPQS